MMRKYILSTITLLFFIAEMNAQYCPLFGNCGEGSITTVKFNGVQNVTGCSSGYEDYTSTVSFQVQPAQVYNLFVDWDPFYDSHIYVWIDWDNSQSWENQTEYYTINTDNPPNSAGTLPILVPATANVGDQVRMRIIHGSIDVVTDPCVGAVGLFGHGEVEDYTVVITDSPLSGNDYCVAKGPDTCGTLVTGANGDTFNYQQISRVQMAGANGSDIDNSSQLFECQSNKGYSNYTNIGASEWVVGETYAIIVSKSNANSLDLAALYVDWNNDTDFDDAGETFNIPVDPGYLTHSVTVTPPAGYAPGIKRARFRTTILANTPSPCGQQNGGEVEDYSILLTDPLAPTPGCVTLTAPSSNAANVCTGNVTYTWDASAGEAATSYKFYLGSDNPPTTLENGTDIGLVNSYSTGYALLPNTKHYWKVVAVNDNGEAVGCTTDSFTTAMNIDPSIDQILLGGNDVDSATVCADVDLAILANISGGTGTVDFAWTGDDIHLNDNSINNPTFNASAGSQTYKLRLTVIDDNNCTARDSVKVYVKDAPVVGTLSADKASVCPNETVTLTLAGYNATITDWEKAEGANPYASINHTQDVLATTINVDTQFKVLLTNGEGCEGESNEVSVTLNAAPSAPTIAVDPSNTACEGETITLTATPGTDVVWNDASNSTTGSIAVTTGGSYNVTYTDPTSGCSATSADETITFNALPASPVISISGATCEGETVTLSTQYSSDLSWDLDGSGTASTATIDVTQDGTYAVTYTDVTTNCSSTSAEQIAFNAKPTAPVIEQSGDSLITNPIQIVNWLDADGNVVETAESYSPDRTPGQTFTAVVVDGNNCESDESNEIAYDHTVSITTYNQIGFEVFPNPATSELNVQVNSSSVAGMYHIKDMAGRTVIAVELVRGVNTISLAEIQSGIYILQDNVGNTIRIVKQ